MKHIGHRVAGLSHAAVSAGLTLAPEHVEILSHIDEADVAIEARYIVTGFKQVPPVEALSEIAEVLDRQVCGALTKLGLPARAATFEKTSVKPNSDLSHDAQQILVYLFKTTDHDQLSVRAMSARLGLDEGMLQYHLDCLDGAGLAEYTSYNYVSGDVYWGLLHRAAGMPSRKNWSDNNAAFGADDLGQYARQWRPLNHCLLLECYLPP